MPVPRMTLAELDRFLSAEFPQAYHPGSGLAIEEVAHGTCRVRLACSDQHMRPGGTISGPAMMMLADFTLYAALLSAIGPVALAVTINLNINFLRRPEPGDLICEARTLKLGKRLAVMEAMLYLDGESAPVAHVTSTWSIPPKSGS